MLNVAQRLKAKPMKKRRSPDVSRLLTTTTLLITTPTRTMTLDKLNWSVGISCEAFLTLLSSILENFKSVLKLGTILFVIWQDWTPNERCKVEISLFCGMTPFKSYIMSMYARQNSSKFILGFTGRLHLRTRYDSGRFSWNVKEVEFVASAAQEKEHF